jgi:hypothetical protein
MWVEDEENTDFMIQNHHPDNVCPNGGCLERILSIKT